jgi:guanidinopropionase
MRTPWATALEQFDIGIAGVPFDGGVSARPGARYGPREIRNMSTMTRAIHHVSGFNPFAACRVGDVGDVPFTNLYDLEKANDEIRRFLQPFFAGGKKMLITGGDHSIIWIALVHLTLLRCCTSDLRPPVDLSAASTCIIRSCSDFGRM